jgi:hypothetical protein
LNLIIHYNPFNPLALRTPSHPSNDCFIIKNNLPEQIVRPNRVGTPILSVRLGWYGL